MPILTTTVSSTGTVKLTASTRKKLLTKLATYKALKAQLDPIKTQMKALTEELGAIRDVETGEQKLVLEGIGSITLVAPTYKKFNEKAFIANGGDIAIYRMSID